MILFLIRTLILRLYFALTGFQKEVEFLLMLSLVYLHQKFRVYQELL